MLMAEMRERHGREEMTPRIFADFQNADPKGRVRLNTQGTHRDLERLGLALSDGMAVRLSDGELEADGEVEYSTEEDMWVAKIDWRVLFDGE